MLLGEWCSTGVLLSVQPQAVCVEFLPVDMSLCGFQVQATYMSMFKALYTNFLQVVLDMRNALMWSLLLLLLPVM